MTQPTSVQAFFAEMKRRRVFRVMALYGVVAFLVLQIADLVFPILELPQWTLQFVLMLALLGFPLAIVIAWAFEATDDGIRRTVPAAAEEIQAIVAEPASRRWPAGVLALAGMGLLFWTGWWMGNRGAADVGVPNLLVAEARAADLKTIAALPLQNLNGDEDNRLIALGIHDDLITQMQRIAALRVTSRTSVLEYEDADRSVRDIAGELGVAYILEGSVRSAGERVVINVKLIDAASDEQLWAQRYDENVSPAELFDVQSEIARRVVDALEAELTPGDIETLASITPPASSAAQQWYYRAIDAYARSSMDGIKPAIDAMRRAIELDSAYVAAWSRLAKYESRLTQAGEDRRQEALEAVERSEALAPGSVEANLARGYYEYYGRRDYAAALVAFQAAERLAPSDGEAAFAVALIQRRVGDWEPSTVTSRKAIQLDPRNVMYTINLATNMEYMGAFAEADALLERALSLSPDNPLTRAMKTVNLVSIDGSTRRANQLAAEIGLDPVSYYENWALYSLAMLDRDAARAAAILRPMDTGGVPLIDLLRTQRLARVAHFAGDARAAAVIADSALAIADDVLMSDLESLVRRGYLHAIAGRRDEGMRALDAADRQMREWEDHVDQTSQAVDLVDAFGLVGETDRGIDLLEDLVERPAAPLTAASMRLDPMYDPYREDPRFEDLLRRRDAFEADGAEWAEAGGPWVP